MSIVLLVIIGAAAGFLATRLMRVQADVPTSILIGVGGALIGGLLLRWLVSMLGVASGIVGAVAGAILLIWLWQQVTGR